MTLLAVDPGLDNGIAVIGDGGELLLATEIPALGEGPSKRLAISRMGELISQFHVTSAIVEDVSAMPKQGISSTFRFGRAAGHLEGALMALNVPIAFVRPNVWKKSYGTAGATPNGMRALAAQRWPKQQDLFIRVKDHNRAAAALLGLWAHSKNGAL